MSQRNRHVKMFGAIDLIKRLTARRGFKDLPGGGHFF